MSTVPDGLGFERSKSEKICWIFEVSTSEISDVIRSMPYTLTFYNLPVVSSIGISYSFVSLLSVVLPTLVMDMFTDFPLKFNFLAAAFLRSALNLIKLQ